MFFVEVMLGFVILCFLTLAFLFVTYFLAVLSERISDLFSFINYYYKNR